MSYRFIRDGQDVLYVKDMANPNNVIRESLPLGNDDFTIVNYNSDNVVIGLQIIQYTTLTYDWWMNDPHVRIELPPEMANAVARWLKANILA